MKSTVGMQVYLEGVIENSANKGRVDEEIDTVWPIPEYKGYPTE